MSHSILSQPFFHNEEAAYQYVEGKLWPAGAVCPHCGVIGRAGKLLGKSTWASPSFPDTFNDMMCSGDINDEDKKKLHGRVQA